MKKQIQHYWWLVVVFILSIGITGCDREDHSQPTALESTDRSAMQLANFGACPGVSDEFGAYVGHEEFVIQVPAGEYLLEYTTDLGRFYIAFRATASSLLYVGLQQGDVVQEAIIHTGRITDTSGETQEHGDVTLFAWPGSTRTWQEVFQFSWMEE